MITNIVKKININNYLGICEYVDRLVKKYICIYVYVGLVIFKYFHKE